MYDIIIVGAGTAGLSAAIYGVRSGKSVLVLEAKSYGGQIINSPEVENYPGIKHISGFEFATNLYEQVKGLGADVVFERVVEITDCNDFKVVVTDDNKYESKAVILATGAENRPLGVDREEEMVGAGVSYCATCDGVFYRGRDVAVIGGGNTALEDAMFLSNYCSKVYLVHRRDSFRGEEKQLEILKAKGNIEFILNSTVIQLNGTENVESITVKNKITEEENDIPVSGVFVAIGQMPKNEIFSELIEIDKKGYIVAAEECKTNVSGIFTAGDCRTKNVRQLATAASDGAIAGLAACQYIG